MRFLKYIVFFLYFSISILYSTDFEKIADEFYIKRNRLRNGKPDISIIENAIENYRKALENNETNDILLYKYVKAIDFKYNYLIENKESEKRKTYKKLITLLEKNYKNNKDSPYLNYSLALTWGRYGELIGIIKAARKGIAGKVKKYAEQLYRIDKKFENYFASLVLGRLHFKTPKIPFILNWPDLDKSQKYLEEVVKNDPRSLWAKYFLADTLYELGKIEKAKFYYNQVKNAVPRRNYFLEDIKAQRKCIERLKQIDN